MNWPIDRRIVAAELGFAGITQNSLDGTSNRDFVIDYLSAAATCAMHLSRLGSELVIWSSTEFGFCELDEGFSSGSSIMPQKKNPDSAELLRAKSPRVAAAHGTLLGVMHALPLTYGKDMQEDKEPLWDAIDTVESSLEATAGTSRTSSSTGRAWKRPPATRCWPRRRSPTCSSARACRSARPTGSSASWSATRRRRHAPLGAQPRADRHSLRRARGEREEYYEVLQRGSWLESKQIAGGTGSEPFAAQIEEAAGARRVTATRPGRDERAPPSAGGTCSSGSGLISSIVRPRGSPPSCGCRLFFGGVGG